MVENLNMKCGNQQDIQGILKKKYPHYLPLYQSGFDKKYWDKIEEQLRVLSKKFNISLKGFYRH